jgi:glycosyltransferase involved in cell wall biosynthesis
MPDGSATARAIWEQLALPALARRDRLEVLHGLVNVVPLAAPCPTVVTVHDLAFLRRPDLVPARRRRYFGAMLRAAVRRAARVIAVSEWTKGDVVELLGVAPERVAVTHLAADETFRPADAATLIAFRARQGLERPYVLFVGNLEPRKNVAGLLRAFALLITEVEHELVLVGGEGWMTEEISAALADPRLRDRVRRVGWVEPAALPLWYGAADLFVFPSFYEGFGLPPLESMACGTPVIAANVTALPEVVGDAALTVDPTDAEAMAGAMRRVLFDPALAADLRRRGLSRAEDFSWVATAAATVGVFREVVG